MEGDNIMDYPDDFDTSAFPAGKRIAVSRTAGIWVMVSFFLIIVCCLALPWVQKNTVIDPLVVYVNGSNGTWELVGTQKTHQDMPYYVSVQRALVGLFTEKWFTLSDDATVNAERWDSCDRETVCATRVDSSLYTHAGCDLYCMTDDEFYRNFTTNVLPMYQTTASFGERWYVNPSKIIVNQNGNITDQGGEWIVRATVRSSINGNFDIIAYVQVMRDTERYPQTLGYYVSNFNSYREQ